MALFSSTATTEESTPPERPSTTSSSPILRFRDSTAASTQLPRFQLFFAPQTLNTKLDSICVPYCVCTTSGWNWSAYILLSLLNIAANGQVADTAPLSKSAGIASTLSPWLIHTVIVLGISLNSGLPGMTSIVIFPYSRSIPGTTLPPSFWLMSCIP